MYGFGVPSCASSSLIKFLLIKKTNSFFFDKKLLVIFFDNKPTSSYLACSLNANVMLLKWTTSKWYCFIACLKVRVQNKLISYLKGNNGIMYFTTLNYMYIMYFTAHFLVHWIRWIQFQFMKQSFSCFHNSPIYSIVLVVFLRVSSSTHLFLLFIHDLSSCFENWYCHGQFQSLIYPSYQ